MVTRYKKKSSDLIGQLTCCQELAKFDFCFFLIISWPWVSKLCCCFFIVIISWSRCSKSLLCPAHKKSSLSPLCFRTYSVVSKSSKENVIFDKKFVLVHEYLVSHVSHFTQLVLTKIMLNFVSFITENTGKNRIVKFRIFYLNILWNNSNVIILLSHSFKKKYIHRPGYWYGPILHEVCFLSNFGQQNSEWN